MAKNNPSKMICHQATFELTITLLRIIVLSDKMIIFSTFNFFKTFAHGHSSDAL